MSGSHQSIKRRSQLGGTSIRDVRNRLVDRGIVLFAAIAPIALAVSLSRALEHGWHQLHTFHIVLTTVAIAVAVGRKRLPYSLRSLFLLVVLLSIGVAGVATWGLLGGGILSLFSMVLAAAITFGTRIGLIACAVSMVILLAAGIAVDSAVLTFGFDVSAYATSLTSWLNMVTSFLLFASTVVVALGVVHESLATSLSDLQDSHEQQQRLANNLIDSFLYRRDPDGVFQYVSSSVLQVLGYGRDELSLHFTAYLTDDPVNEKAAEHVEQSGSGIQQPPFEVQVRHKNGEVRWLEVSETPVRDKAAKVIVVEGLAHDVTARKNAERELQRRQRAITLSNRIANVFLTSPKDDIYNDILDAVLGPLESKIGYFGYIDRVGALVCPSMTRVVWDRCQVPEKRIVFPRESWGGLWGLSLTERRSVLANQGLQLPGGHLRLENTLIVPILHQGNLIGQFAVANKAGGYDEYDQELLERVATHTAPILHAILEEDRQREIRETLEGQLLQSQKLEAVGSLAGGIAHDFNNILSAVLGYAELAKEDSKDEHVTGDIEQIIVAGKRARDLVSQILTFSRPADREKHPIRVEPVVTEAVRLLRASIPTTVDIRTEIAQDCGLVLADATQIHQIIMNLCTNAHHAMRDSAHPRLTVRLAEVQVSEDEAALNIDLRAQPYVLLAVSDTGSGMDEEAQMRLFEPYFSTKEAGEGTGLGMALVHSIVQAHDGAITIYSEPGRGTTINVYLPIHDDIAVRPDAGDVADKPSGKERILFVDDEAPLGDIAKKGLERLGYSVEVFFNPAEALEWFKRSAESVDILVTDLTMPQLSGKQLVMNIREIRADIPVIICSGLAEPARDALKNISGVCGILDKPIHMHTLARAIRKIFDSG